MREFTEPNPFSSSRYRDGRNAIYRTTNRRTVSELHAPRRDRDEPHRRRPPYRFDPWNFRDGHPDGGSVIVVASGFRGPAFWGPPAYPCQTPYYDSWACGGPDFLNVFHGGWRHGGYGGFSYIYNPWPVYSTCYFYGTEYVESPSQTVYVTEPAITLYAEGTPATSSQTAVSGSAAQAETTVWDVAPATERIDTTATRCYCPCQCNGLQACVCDYPCGSEYAVDATAFDLGTVFESYAESLDPETIWSSYAGLDRGNPEADSGGADAAAQ